MENNQSSFILFKTEDEKISVDVRFEDETVWLSQEQMANLFGKAKSTINEHIKNIFSEGELDEKVAVRKFRITTQHALCRSRTNSRRSHFYSCRCRKRVYGLNDFSGQSSIPEFYKELTEQTASGASVKTTLPLSNVLCVQFHI